MGIIKRLIKPIYIYILAYFLVNLLFLDTFPKMHSDESWLSGLTRSMMDGGLNNTEYFFDEYIRYPHAIKSVFHIIQMGFIGVLGYSLFTVRLISLVFSCLTLFFFYKTSMVLFNKNKLKSMIATIVLSIDINYIYISHFARQEAIILCAMVFCIYKLIAVQNWSCKKDIMLGAVIGLCVGIHPNSFILALVAGILYLYRIFDAKNMKIKNLVLLITVVVGFAGLFVALSFRFNPTFIPDYFIYGETQGVSKSLLQRILYVDTYYRQLFNMDSVTYYMPNIQIQLILFVVSSILGLFFVKKDRKILMLLLSVFSINIGYLIIGRYSQPGVVFVFPFCYLILLCLLSKLDKAVYINIVILFLVLASTAVQLNGQISNEYNRYLDEIEQNIPKESKVLGNLNIEYAMEVEGFYDIRNLGYINQGEFAEYIESRDIEYIVYNEEMDFIYDKRPVWNILYGNVFPYYEDMQRFLNKNCELIHEFESEYAMRIMAFSDDKDWSCKIYKVKEAK